MNKYLMYLRKSRADRDFVNEDVMATLNRHKQRLDDFCASAKICVEKCFFEIISADSIAARPEMLKLLQLVETGSYAGVVVIDLERLCRGDSIDQGIVMNTFKYSNTKIITPYKTYDFANEYDEEYAEMGLMMGRSEYRKIKRRLWNGRLDSVREGKYVGGNPPYGYCTYKLKGQKGFSLQVIPEQAKVVQLIYDMYVNGFVDIDGRWREAGAHLIARRLNEMGYVNQFDRQWSEGHITKILQDETYVGKVVFMRRRARKEMKNGELVVVEENNSPDKIVHDGFHESIIPDDIFRAAQKKRSQKQVPHLRRAAEMQNPLCGIVQCGFCGKHMRLRSTDKQGKRALFCPNVNCKCVGSYIDLVEDRLLVALKQWTSGYLIENQCDDDDQSALLSSLASSMSGADQELSATRKQLQNIYTLLEQGVYTVELFRERYAAIQETISALEDRISSSQAEYNRILEYTEAKKSLVPKVETVVEKYNSIPTASEKNVMLKEVLEKIVYEKTARGKKHGDEFTIKLYPKIPEL